MIRYSRFGIGIFFLMCSCGESPRQFASATVCVNSNAGIVEFRNEFISIAKRNGMEITDKGSDAQKSLESLGSYDLIKNKIILMTAMKDDDSFSIGNIGISKYQIGMGFSSSLSKNDSLKFYDNVIGSFSRKWNIIKIDNGKGIKPMASCK